MPVAAAAAPVLSERETGLVFFNKVVGKICKEKDVVRYRRLQKEQQALISQNKIERLSERLMKMIDRPAQLGPLEFVYIPRPAVDETKPVPAAGSKDGQSMKRTRPAKAALSYTCMTLIIHV